jgi:hypothetical protein
MTKSQLEKILFLDVETAPIVYNYSDLEKDMKELWDKRWQYNKEIDPAQRYEKAGIYAEFSKVVCIGLGYYNEGKFRVKTIVGENEADLLKRFAEVLKLHFNTESHLLCAHNGKEFDFPFVCRRFLVNNLPLPKILQIQGKKPWDVRHIDTLDLWKFGDIKNYTSLDLLARVLGIPSPKSQMDGSMVAKVYHEDKDIKRIQDYCLGDVITLARVYNRFAGNGNLNEDDIIFV